ncbi:MAG: hypothetical protein RR428_08250 [Coprobacillus sp.]
MKKIGIVIGAALLITMAFVIVYRSGRGSQKEADYSSVTSFEKSTGNSFYNFYEPKWYLSRERNKTTLKKLDEVSIQYNSDAKQEYWISYENIDQYGTYIYLGIDRSGKAWDNEDKKMITQDGNEYETVLYDQDSGKSRICEVHYINKKKELRIIVEIGTRSSNPMTNELMLQNCIDMIEDSFEIN